MELYRTDQRRWFGQTTRQRIIRRQGIFQRRGRKHVLVGRAVPVHARQRAVHRIQTAPAGQRRVVRVAEQDVQRGRLVGVVRLDDAQPALRQTQVHPRGTPAAARRELKCRPEFAGEDGRGAVRALRLPQTGLL